MQPARQEPRAPQAAFRGCMMRWAPERQQAPEAARVSSQCKDCGRGKGWSKLTKVNCLHLLFSAVRTNYNALDRKSSVTVLRRK